jgi:hypothetical protein
MGVTKKIVVSEKFKVTAKPVTTKFLVDQELGSKPGSTPSSRAKSGRVVYKPESTGSEDLNRQTAKVVLR